MERKRKNGFSLIELIIVMVILGVITAIAVPRMSRGTAGADVTGLQADLQVIRGAIELYKVDHGTYPTDETTIADQLTKKTDLDGTINAAGEYGPYLAVVPPLKTGAKKGEIAFEAAGAVPPTSEENTAGWLYDPTSGSVWANDTNHFDK